VTRRLPLSAFRLPLIGAMYLLAYVLLDRYSNVGSFGIAWRPSTGLGFALMLVHGRKMAPLLFAAPLVAGVCNPGMPLPVWLAIIEAGLIGGGYVFATLVLLRPGLNFSAALLSLRDVFLFLLAAIVSSAAVAAAVGGALFAAGRLEAGDLTSIMLQYWIGDTTGIAIVGTFGLLALTRDRFILSDWRSAAKAAVIALLIAVAVGSARNEQLQLFFLLFLPITWIAVSSGLEGIGIALLVTQIGLVAALHFSDVSVADIAAMQARMAVLAVTGLVAGALVTETRSAEQKLRENQAAITRLSRLGSMGELAIAVAHEVNQPLSAAGTYSRLVTESLADETLKDPGIIRTAEKATAQVERAALVIKRLRALVRLGRSELSPIAIGQIVEEALDLVRPALERSNIAVSVEIDDTLPPVMADRIQIGQVLINLLRNAAEAITGGAMSERGISLTASRMGPGFAEISVADTGPGFPAGLVRTGPVLFETNKAEGLGVGLFLCRSIVESHGGALRLDSCGTGACVSFTLPFARGDADGG
jgi:two-component system sensor kinase FixL